MKPLNSVLLQIFIAAIFCEITSSEEEVDPCKKQPFRGRCPGPNGVQQRSQFVLRYHVKNGECVSYPYGHCNNDDNEPKLFRYKDECEQNCLTKRSRVEGVGIVNVEDGSSDGETYATLGPFLENSTEDSSKTECQKLRDHSDKGGFVPQCTAHGDFVPLQCEPGDLICFCVDENGVEIKHSRCKPGEPKPDCEKIRIASPMRTNECTGPSDSGPCVDEIDRWLFDELTQQCRMFKYSGCGGNGNNYPNEQICQQHCIVPVESIDSICGGGIHQRPLKDFNGVTVSCAKTECPAGYKCTGDHKNFVCCPDISKITSTSTTPSQSEFESAESRCNLPKDKGSCDNYMLRFYFNKEIGQCKHFFYGGCEGNTNNFFNLEECEAVCTGKKVESSSTTLAPATSENHLPESTIGLTNSPDIAEITSTEGEESTTEPKKSEVHPQVFGDRRIEKQPLPPPTQPPTTTTTAEQPTPKTTRRRATITTTSTRATTTVDLSENRCHHPKDSGDCGGQFARWFWNQDEKSCEAFIYTGCNGNGNNFANREECLTICHEEAMTPAPSPHTTPDIENACESEIEPGDCTGVFMRYGFDIHTGECRQFQYGGCGGNGNNFGSMSECKRKCLNKSTVLSNNICDHPIDSGECNGAFTRFGYDNDENVCRQFVYGGCSGNGNNFPTMADCRMACIKVKCPPEPKCETSKCQLVNDARGCPFCSCPPTQPIRTLPEIPRLPACSPIDEQLCVEPCVIFVNRRNCKECVCPSTQPIPQLFHSKAPKLPSKTGGDFIDFKHVFEQPTPPPDVLLPPAFTDFATLRPAPPAPETHERTGSTRVDVTNGPPAPPSPPAAFGTQGVTNNNVDALPPPKQPAQPPIPPPTFINVEICTLPLDTGNPACTKTNQRWYFNSLQGECESFVYTGCAGNRNHFFSQRECQIFCARFSLSDSPALPVETSPPASVLVPFNNKHDHTSNEERVEITIQDSHFTAPSVQSQPETLATLAIPIVPRDRIIVPKADESDDTCILPPDAGPCRDFVHRWFYNSQTERCEPFSYGSCAGNKNNFAELSLCESKCIAEMNPSAKLPPRCAHERDDGEGNGYFPKWYFNRHNLRCEQFVYRGQLGNDNQFSTQHDCESYCQNDQEVTQTPQPTPPRKIPVIVPPSEDRILKTPPAEIKPIAPDEIILKGARITEVDGNVESPKPMLSPPPVSPPPTNAGYDAVLLPKDEPKINPAEMPPILGPSPPMELNYATGERFDGKNNQTVTNRVGGIKNFPIRPDSDKPFPVGSFDPKFVSTSFGKASEQVENQPSVASTTETNVMDNDVAETSPTENVLHNQTNEEQSVRYHIPVCPNGLNSMQYADGRPVMCLPGKDHCPNKSVCYFNGLDYFCCPNDDDPYDQHIFGGYDGEEVKHGYKYTIEKSGIRRSRFLKRSKRQQQGVSISERAPEKLAHTKQKSLSRMSPCVQRVQKGNCSDSKLRFYYDVIVDECRLFYFSGCDGNSNNFATRQECEQRCKIGPIITMMPPVSIPPGRCPGLPLGGNNPVLCGNRTDSIGCPQGYYCRSGPPDVCCPTNSDNRIYEAMAIAEQRNRNEIRRKPFISTASAQDKEYIGQNEHNKLHYNPNQDDWQQHEHQFQEQGRSIDEEPPLENNQQQHQTEQSQSMSPQQNNTDSPPAIALAAPTQLEVQASSDDFEQQPLHDSPKAHGTSEKLFCPDGSDGLASQSGTPMICGTGFDGHQLCPQGYYCSMDHEKNSRLCCELTVRGSQIPAAVPNSIPPYFGHRPANPEEVIPKGSLPSDPKPPKLKVPSPKLKTQLDEELPADDIGLQEDESKTAVLVDERANNQTELDHLFIQPPSVDRVYGRANKNLPNIPPKDWEGVGAEDPFDDVELSNEEPNDKKASICILPPNEGRICKKDEPTPYSNLQFFYNANERRCKVFFHKGCGGNANRFRTKKECEDYCFQQAQN